MNSLRGPSHSPLASGAGAISRDDVAAVLVALLDAPSTSGKTLELIGGAVSVLAAVAQA